MPHRTTITGSAISFDVAKLERRIAAFCAANNITNETQLDAFIDGLNGTTMVPVVKAFLKALVKVG